MSHFDASIRAAFEMGLAQGQHDAAEIERLAHRHPYLSQALARIDAELKRENEQSRLAVQATMPVALAGSYDR